MRSALKAEIMVDHFHGQVIGLGKIGGGGPGHGRYLRDRRPADCPVKVVVDAIAGVGAIIEREKPRASIALRDLLGSPIVPLSLDKSDGYAEQSSRAMMNVLRFEVAQRALCSIGTIGGE
jgi:hypothetical protein